MIFFKKYILRYLTLILFIISFGNIQLKAQSYQRHETVLAYICQFPNHITWKNEQQYENFHFLIISENEQLIDDFQKVSESLRIKNKPIKLSITSNPDFDYSDVRAIFISSDMNDLYLNVFDKIEGKQIILISDSYKDQRFAMVNVYDSEANKLVFEINKANIINQNLSISDEVLLLGGNLIDVAELYRESQQSLRSMEKALKNYDEILDSLNTQILHVKNNIETQEKEIQNQNTLINKQKFELEKQLSKIEEQKQLAKKQISVLKAKHDSIETQSKLLSIFQKQLGNQRNEIAKGKGVLKQQQFNLQIMDSEIQNKIKILGQQDITINKQRQILILFIIVIILVIASIIIIFKAYRSNKQKNAILNIQKEEIEKINEELKSSNEELFQKNEEISVTLEKLKEAQNQLIQSEKMASLGVLTAGIAHEINNPINFVYTGVNSLKKDFSDISHVLDEINNLTPDIENQKEFILKISELKEKYYFTDAYDAIQQTIKHIALGSERTAKIIKGLRNFSRMEKDEWQLSNIHTVIDDVLVLLKNKYKHHIKITKQFDLDLPEIECYPGKINQAILNILTNAIDAIKEKGQIFIHTSLLPDKILISIKDTGIGINEDNKSRIFDPFFTTKDVGKGIGLGLSITYGIIQEHNGQIEINSENKNGTEFIIKLPIKQTIY